MGLFEIFTKGDCIYFPGCITYYKYNNNFELYKKIFNKLEIKFRLLNKQNCSGYETWESGYYHEMRKLIQNNFNAFKEENIKKIITTEPGCYKIFSKDYPNVIPDWNIKIINIWDMILKKLIKKQRLISKREETITYHDPCYLGRYCNIYDIPREIIRLLGYNIKEMEDNKEYSYCCGSCGGLTRTSPELANKIAKERILQAKRIGVKKMIVVGFENYNLLNENSADSGINIIELGELIADSINIKKLEVDGTNEGGNNE